MDYPENFYYLLFQYDERLRPALLRPYLRRGHSPYELFAHADIVAGDSKAQRELRSALRSLRHAGSHSEAWLAAQRSWHLLQQFAVTVIGLPSSDYPPLLRELPDPPLQLYCRGRIGCLQEPQIAIVGSRRASAGGLDSAKEFARDLAVAGITITSGLALGIDGSAHRGALEGGGETVAVLGTGIDQQYPRAHIPLMEEIISRGAIVSEYPPTTPPLAGNFPRRNRIIAGLSLGTLVIEAALRSGSLITARLAAEYNREVFALPGSIHQPQAKGCHQLLRSGAALTETVADILAPLQPQLAAYIGTNPQKPLAEAAVDKDAGQRLPADLTSVLQAVGFEPTSLDLVLERATLPPGELESALLELELGGYLEQLNGYYQRR